MIIFKTIRRYERRLLRGIIDLIIPPVCMYCNKVSSGLSELCTDCAAKYFRERRTTCPNCGQTVRDCICECGFSKITRTIIGEKSSFSLTFYVGAQKAYNKERITERLILLLKDKGYFACFFADELADEIFQLFENSGESLDEWTLTYTPRSVENYRRTGLDQGEEVTQYLAKRLGIPCKKTFDKIQGEEQKTLNLEERMINASVTLIPKRNSIKKGEKYLLFDDIITSGATVMAAARHLYFCGAAEVFPISIARNLPHKK